MSETVKPQCILYAMGHSKRGKTTCFEEGAVERIKPGLNEFCKVGLTKSAYQKGHGQQHGF